MSTLRVVLVFARVPVLGRVKTRLAARVGEREALRVHRVLLEHAMSIASRVPGATAELWIAGDDADGECAALAVRFGHRLVRQSQGDLGARMQDALARTLGDGRLPVLIGCDCPPLTALDLEDAFAALERADAVFGPTEDGGYALVGVSRELPQVFAAPRWGEDSVMETTRSLLRAQGATWQELRVLWDLDDGDDYDRWMRAADDR
jgi:rSAM/selenodomain-associated transferase 1